MGRLGNDPRDLYCHKLPATEALLQNFQIQCASTFGRFLTVCYLASDRGIEEVWVPVGERSFYVNLCAS